MKRLVCVMGLMAGALTSSLAWSQSSVSAPSRPSQFGDFQGDGYYWYKQDPEAEVVVPPKPEPPKPPPKTEPEKPPKTAKPEPAPMSVEWLQANMPKLLNLAVNNPTKENVANYMYAQRVILDKSQTFSEVARDVVSLDPFLDENNRVPFATYARTMFDRGVMDGEDDVMRHMATTSGIWVFVDEPRFCGACKDYVDKVLVGVEKPKPMGFASRFNFPLKVVNVRSPEGRAAARRLNLKITPTTVLAVPPTSLYVVSQGLMAENALKEKIIISARSGGHIPAELLSKARPYSKGVLSTSEIQQGLKDSQDPAEVMKNFRDRLGGSSP
jgi:conjugal transfer pilus assembly protein TraF